MIEPIRCFQYNNTGNSFFPFPLLFPEGENMNIKHFNIMVTDQECGHARDPEIRRT